MGLFKKLKDILYDEEEYTEQIKITPEMRNEETEAKEEIKEIPKKPVEPKKVEPVKEEKLEETRTTELNFKKEPVQSERELFQSSQFPFFDFDEEEFKQTNPPARPIVEEKPTERKPVQPNVLEYERTKKVERRTDYGRYEKTEITQTTERKKFKPSPTISPVYGILNKDYEKEDIQQRGSEKKVDVQTVRDKAFGEVKPKEVVTKEEPKTTFYQETNTVTISTPVNKEQKVKTIDELLEDTEVTKPKKEIDADLVDELDSIAEELEMPKKTEKKIEQTQEMKTPVPEDTLENDLFNLIDSMYDNNEDGE